MQWRQDLTQNKVTSKDIFHCEQCGDCCTGYGGTYITPKDINAIAKYINADAKKFVDDYCQISEGKPIIKISDNGKCIFFDEKTQCTIHPVKPRMCRAWPFIKNVIKAPGNWEIMSEACAGIRTGFPHSDIKKCIQKEIDTLDELRKDLD